MATRAATRTATAPAANQSPAPEAEAKKPGSTRTRRAAADQVLTKVSGYTTPDGAKHATKKEARQHLALCEFQAYIDGGHPMVNGIGDDATAVHSVVIATWIRQNGAAVRSFLSASRG